MSIDDVLIEKAQRYAGDVKTSDLLEMGLKAFIEGAAADRLAALGGSDPEASVARRRSAPMVAEDAVIYQAVENSKKGKK